MKKDQTYIIVSNHQSSLDTLGTYSCPLSEHLLLLTTLLYAGLFQFWHIMDKCTVIAKKEILYVFPFGLAAWLCGLVFIPRNQGLLSRHIMQEATKRLKKENVMYPLFFLIRLVCIVFYILHGNCVLF